MAHIKTFGTYDDNTYQQILRCAGEDNLAVLCADNHLGYSQPIGGAVAYEDYISPSGVGYDIGCGNKAILTELMYQDIREDIPKLMDQIFSRIQFGMGKNSLSQIESHPVLDKIMDASVVYQKRMHQLARNQLGTVGGGNHYVDLFRDDKDRIWIGVHFGSRGFGHKTASGFMALAKDRNWQDRINDSMDAPPILIKTDTDLGQAYIEAMTLAGDYAYAGRDVVCDEVLDILGAQNLFEVHNHHNFAWNELHFGKNVWVVRKGCTPAFPGQKGFVGGSMGDISVILEGLDHPENKEGLYSTVHGAGRQMSRTEARGRYRRYWACCDRDCSNVFPSTGNMHPTKGLCPDHPNAKITKIKVLEGGRINWNRTLDALKGLGVELRGGGADEAPGAYKSLSDVLHAHNNTIKILHTLFPIGVAMAGPNVKDLYKD